MVTKSLRLDQSLSDIIVDYRSVNCHYREISSRRLWFDSWKETWFRWQVSGDGVLYPYSLQSSLGEETFEKSRLITCFRSTENWMTIEEHICFSFRASRKCCTENTFRQQYYRSRCLFEYIDYDVMPSAIISSPRFSVRKFLQFWSLAHFRSILAEKNIVDPLPSEQSQSIVIYCIAICRQ